MSIITVSRGAYSGGEALAERLADRLGYQCLSREANLETAANRYRIPADVLAAAMEKRPSFWERVLGERAAYLTFARATLCEQAVEGRLVYHGYLGQFLLPGVSHVISVRVIADLETRLQSAQQLQDLSHNDALPTIEKVDKERREWTRFLFGADWEDPHLYDLVLNLSRMRMETACEMVFKMTEQDEFRPTPVSLKAMRDLALQSRVSAALAMDFRTRDTALEVIADDGVVTITGTTRWSEVEHAVPAVVRQVEGVQEVKCDIIGATPPSPLTWY
jgi:cytidylate kinase